jgi:hypothetical protein
MGYRRRCCSVLLTYIYILGSTEGSAAQKSKVFGGKKAKEKRENVTDCFEERKRK